MRTTQVSGVYSFTHVPLGLKTYVPTGWETVHTGAAWLALGTALPEHTWDWLYPGASDWVSPDDAASVLQSYVRLGAKNLDDLPRWLVRRLRAMGLTHLLRPAIKGDPGPQACAQQRAAESMLQSLRAEDSPSPWELHEAILGASETLLRALAGGELPAFGWPGSAKPEPVTTPRQRIALEILQGPVSLGPRGLMPCLPGEEPAEPFFCDLRFPAEGLLKLRPAQPSANGIRVREDDRGQQAHPAAEAWMRALAERSPLPKWDFALKDCMRATGCTYRQARAALSSLPEHLRRKRGRPRSTDAEKRAVKIGR